MNFIKKLVLIVILSFTILSACKKPEKGTGLLLDPERYEQVDLKPTLLTRQYLSLPKSYSLKKYCPIPGDQGGYGTCVGWSTAYAARTISESIALKRTNRTTTTNNVYSPAHIYKNISDDPSCVSGTYLIDALDFMKNPGAVKRIPEEINTDFKDVSLSIYRTAKNYPITDYVRLFQKWGISGITNVYDEKILPVKKSISEGKPVILSIKSPGSLHVYGKELWEPTENPAAPFNGHAICLIGYDDNKHGGAFELQNSWGTSWGSSGYIWVSYNDFANWCFEAYGIIEDLNNFKDAAKFSASIEIQVSNSTSGMPVSYDRQGFYKTNSSYPSGTKFRFLLTNLHPSYVYAFASDSNSSEIERIFPMKGISPILDYYESAIAWPSEHHWIELNEIIGTDYLIVLFSKQVLDINSIEEQFINEKGTFPQRVSRATGTNFVPYNNVYYKNNVIDFSLDSNNPNAILGLLLAIDHVAR